MFKFYLDVDELIMDIRKQLRLNLGVESITGRVLKDLFEDMDMDESHSIDKSEFMRAMHSINFDINPLDVDGVYHRYDVNDDGYLDYSEFIDLIGLTRK